MTLQQTTRAMSDERGKGTISLRALMTRGMLRASAVLLSVLISCATREKAPPRRPRTRCEELLASRREHPSAIRLPPAEYDFCRNQVAAELLTQIDRDGAALD
jgi:hypothetical protein